MRRCVVRGKLCCKYAAYIIFICIQVIAAQYAVAQISGITNITSTPVPGVPHDYITGVNEIVNPANGSVSVRIKAPTPHERGQNWPTYAYRYDSDGQWNLTPGWSSVANKGINLVILTQLVYGDQYNPFGLNWTNSGSRSANFGPIDSYLVCPNASYAYMYTDPDGGLHNLGLAYMNPGTNDGNPDKYACGAFGYSMYMQGGDARYKAELSKDGLTTYVVDSHGDSVIMGHVLPTLSSNPSRTEDTNGNYVNTTGRTWSRSGYYAN